MWSEELARKEYRNVEDTVAYRQTQDRIEIDRRCRFLADANLGGKNDRFRLEVVPIAYQGIVVL